MNKHTQRENCTRGHADRKADRQEDGHTKEKIKRANRETNIPLPADNATRQTTQNQNRISSLKAKSVKEALTFTRQLICGN